MKVYIGTPPHLVEVFTPAVSGRLTAPLRHYVRHSPTGFSWGYGGSGPSDLARCILLEHLGVVPGSPVPSEAETEARVERLYQRFKFDVIAEFEMGSSFTLTTEQIDEWMEKNEQAG